jgi:hypothetical protein
MSYRGLLAGAAALALSGCDLLPEIKAESVSRGQTRILSTAPFLAGAKADTISFEDRWLRQDYTLLTGRGLQAEFLYSTAFTEALPESGVLEVSDSFDKATDHWTLNASHPRQQTGAMGRVDRVGQALFYRPYRITDLGWECMALKSEWDTAGRDIEFRAGKAVTGYICDTRGDAMTAERALQIARSMTFVGQDTPRNPPLPLDSAQGAALVAEARGQGSGGARGIPSFPMRIGRELLDRAFIQDGGDGGAAIGGF